MQHQWGPPHYPEQHAQYGASYGYQPYGYGQHGQPPPQDYGYGQHGQHVQHGQHGQHGQHQYGQHGQHGHHGQPGHYGQYGQHGQHGQFGQHGQQYGQHQPPAQDFYQAPMNGYGEAHYGQGHHAERPHADEERRDRADWEDSRRGGRGGEGKNFESRKGSGKGSRGRPEEAGSRDLVRSRSRGRSSSGGSSASSQPKPRRSRKAAGFDCITKPREPGKVPVEATPQRGLKVAPGRKADVHGLKGAAQYNGCEGIVIEGPNDKGRWEVQVDYQCETKTLSLLESNLQPKPSCGWELVIAPIGLGIKETDVSQALTPHGRVRHVKMTNPPGVCLVEMALKEGAEAAFNNLRHFELKGTQVSVDWSTMAKTEMGMCNKRQEKPPPPPTTRSFKEHPTEESLGFRLGQAVVIANLKGAPQFNGCTACVVGFRNDRVEVELEADGAKKTLALKPENLSASPQEERPTAEPEEKPAEPRKRRAKWEENSGGFVVPQEARKPPVDESKGPFPTVSELEQMPIKELKNVLKDHGVDITGCLEKAEFLEKAKERAAQ